MFQDCPEEHRGRGGVLSSHRHQGETQSDLGDSGSGCGQGLHPHSSPGLTAVQGQSLRHHEPPQLRTILCEQFKQHIISIVLFRLRIS